MAEDTLRFVSGQVIAGKYLIEKQIGAGGMGVVAVATHLALGQKVAIKFLNDDAMKDADVIARFEREAKASVQLRSDHVARVLDVGTLENGAPFMVMEYLDGRDLAGILDSGEKVPPPVAVDYVLQACEAIAEAHRLGIVHRDLKPANLFLTTRVDGRALIKVLDFGISKISNEGGGDTKLTSTTAVIGSPSYMSPEQLRASRDVDLRGDIWSLGVILFELLCGSLPFEAANVMELCMRVASDAVPRLETRNPGLPTGLCDIVARCLDKDARGRFQSVSDLVIALEPYQAIEMSTTADRIRRVSGPQTNQLQQYAAPVDTSSARVMVHGGTSVSWGQTQLSVITPKPSAGPKIAFAMIALVTLFGAVGGGAFYMHRKQTLAAQHDIPLPNDRTTLPPYSSSTIPAATIAGGQVNPMPEDRASLSTTPATTANVVASGSAAPSLAGLGPNGSPNGTGNGTGVTASNGGNGGPLALGKKPLGGGRPHGGAATAGALGGSAGTSPGVGPANTAKPAGGGDDILPDARK